MAGFRTHVTTSTVLGCGYAGAGYMMLALPEATAVVGGALCGFSGMLPDLDSDYGVPLRETMAFTAAVTPMLLVGRFQSLALSYDAMVLVAVSIYLLVRFGLTNLIRRRTVHRGMFHSVPAALIFAGIAFLACGAHDFNVRCFKAGGVFCGFMSHLLLDEVYAVEWKRGAWRFKKSFGTAVKLFGDDAWANFSTYSKLVVVLILILGEPSVMERLEARNPNLANTYKQWQQRIEEGGPISNAAQGALGAVRQSAGPWFVPPASVDSAGPDSGGALFPPGFDAPAGHPPTIRGDVDTARRPTTPFEWLISNPNPSTR